MNIYDTPNKSKRRARKIRRLKGKSGKTVFTKYGQYILADKKRLILKDCQFFSLAPIPDIEPKWDSHYDLSGVEFVSYGVLEADLVEEKDYGME